MKKKRRRISKRALTYQHVFFRSRPFGNFAAYNICVVSHPIEHSWPFCLLFSPLACCLALRLISFTVKLIHDICGVWHGRADSNACEKKRKFVYNHSLIKWERCESKITSMMKYWNWVWVIYMNMNRIAHGIYCRLAQLILISFCVFDAWCTVGGSSRLFLFSFVLLLK